MRECDREREPSPERDMIKESKKKKNNALKIQIGDRESGEKWRTAETQIMKETDKQRERQTHREIEGETDTERDRERQTHTGIEGATHRSGKTKRDRGQG